METAMQELEGKARAVKADCCRLLAAFFYPPDMKLFLEEGIGEKLEGLLEIACPEAMPFVPQLEECLEAEDHLDLSIAYTKLFLGPPEVLAPPYASFYLDRGVVMGPSSVAIMKIYKAAGLVLDDEFNEMPDHVTVVLELLYYLLHREAIAGHADAFEEAAQFASARAAFWNDYVITWIPKFCGLIIAADQHPFYTGLAQSLKTFIQCGFPE